MVSKIHQLFCHIGFLSCISDPSLLIYHHNIDTAYIILYVYNIILIASFDALYDFILSKLNYEFAMEDLDPLSYFMGIFVTKHVGCLFLSQKNYAEEIIE